MMKTLAAVVTVAILTGCSSLDFYAPEVGAGWSTSPVKAAKGGLSVEGVTVKKTGEEYSPVVSVGNLLAPSYMGGRREMWSVEGPNGLKATVDVIQSDLVFSGPVDSNVLKANLTDFTKGRQVIKVTLGDESSLSVPGPVTTPPTFTVKGLGVVPVYQGKSGGKVSNYKSWGLTTGLRLTQGEELVGYLSLTNGTALQKAPGANADPLVFALAVIAAQPHFEGKTPAQKVVPEVIDVFGLTLTSTVSHN